MQALYGTNFIKRQIIFYLSLRPHRSKASPPCDMKRVRGGGSAPRSLF